MPVRIDAADWIVADVGVEVERLRVAEFGVGHGLDFGRPVGRHEAAHLIAVVPCPEVVVAGFGVSLVPGEVVLGGVGGIGCGDRDGAKSVSIGQAGKVEQRIAGVVGLLAAGAEPVAEMEVKFSLGLSGQVAVVSGAQPSGLHVGVRPLPRAAVVGHLGQLLAVRAQHVGAGCNEAVVRQAGSGVNRVVATEGRDGSLGHAIALRIVDVLGHGGIARHRRAGHCADAPFAIVKIAVQAVVGDVAGLVVAAALALVRILGGRRHLIVARPVDSAIVLRPNVLSKTPAGGAGIGAALAARERNAGAHLRGAVAEVVVTPAQVRKGVVVLARGGRGRGQTVERVVAEAPRAVNRVGNIQDVARKVVAAAGVGTVLCLIRRVEVRAIPPFHDRAVKGWGTWRKGDEKHPMIISRQNTQTEGPQR